MWRLRHRRTDFGLPVCMRWSHFSCGRPCVLGCPESATRSSSSHSFLFGEQLTDVDLLSGTHHSRMFSHCNFFFCSPPPHLWSWPPWWKRKNPTSNNSAKANNVSAWLPILHPP